MIAIIEDSVNIIHDNLKPEDFDKYKSELVIILNHISRFKSTSITGDDISNLEALNNSFTFFRVEVNKHTRTLHRVNINADMPKIDEKKPVITIPILNE